MRDVKFLGDTFEDFLEWGKDDKQLQKRIVRLIQEVRRTPFEGIGKPEALKGNLSGYWSRRINDEHRLVYEVTDEDIIIHAVRDHY
jgi:toxin YoeB